MTLELKMTKEETENVKNGGFLVMILGGFRIVVTAEKPNN